MRATADLCPCGYDKPWRGARCGRCHLCHGRNYCGCAGCSERKLSGKPCTAKAKVEVKGRWYCGIHDPDARRIRREQAQEAAAERAHDLDQFRESLEYEV